MLTKKDFLDILDSIYSDVKPSKEKPMYWMKGSYSFKSDGVNIYIRLEEDVYIPITIEQYKSGNNAFNHIKGC